jgi:hypothetical protein
MSCTEESLHLSDEIFSVFAKDVEMTDTIYRKEWAGHASMKPAGHKN